MLLAGFQLPFVLDFEPYILENLVGAQDAMMALYNRLLERKPTLRPHLVVDSAFGSFEKLRDIVNAGGNATMSMPSTTKPWLWELLDFGCGIDEGRLALLPLENIIVSSYKVLTETGNEHQIKTISSGCTLKADSADEELVSLVTERRGSGAKSEYLTKFKDGHTEWLSARSFIDDNGVVNLSWLQFVNSEELSAVFESYTHPQHKVASLGPGSFVWAFAKMCDRPCVLLKAGKRLETSPECLNVSSRSSKSSWRAVMAWSPSLKVRSADPRRARVLLRSSAASTLTTTQPWIVSIDCGMR